MTNWKEQFDKGFKERFFNFFPYNGEDKRHYFYTDIKSFISTEIIEKLIADIPDVIMPNAYDSINDESYVKNAELKQQLRDKWL